MKFSRRRPTYARFAILAIIGLLWSQLVLAAHPICSMAAIAMPEMAMAMAGSEDDCHHGEAPSTDEALCVAHCSQGDQTKDVARVPVIPALPPAVSDANAALVFLPADPALHPGLPPPVSWHRPTAHPAAVLLI